MGLQQDLGFRFSPPNAFQRGMQRTAATKAGSWVFQRTLYKIDRPLHRWTNGAVTAPGLLTGLPVVMLTTTGAKSGLARTMPVAGIPYGDDLVVVGTNYAQPKTPAWVFNLLAHRRATVAYRALELDVVAHKVAPADMDSVWQAAGVVYPGFPKYRERIGDSREIHAFVLRRPPAD